MRLRRSIHFFDLESIYRSSLHFTVSVRPLNIPPKNILICKWIVYQVVSVRTFTWDLFTIEHRCVLDKYRRSKYRGVLTLFKSTRSLIWSDDFFGILLSYRYCVLSSVIIFTYLITINVLKLLKSFLTWLTFFVWNFLMYYIHETWLTNTGRGFHIQLWDLDLHYSKVPLQKPSINPVLPP